MKQYFEELASFYSSLSFEKLDKREVLFAKICLFDFVGCSIAAVAQKRNQSVYGLIKTLDNGRNEASLWGTNFKSSVPAAAFINGVISSTLEFDDMSSIGASVHPSVSIIPAAIATAEKYGSSGKEFIKALVFGYEISNRFGLLAAEKIRDLGIHGPGFMGGLAAVSSAGILSNLSIEQLLNAFSITASLSPICPFINFIDGCDVKNIYGGWSTYVSMLAIEMALNGMTGSNRMFDGPKSLKSIFASEKGKNVRPSDHHYSMDYSFKTFPACGSLQAILTSIDELLHVESIDLEEIDNVIIYTYPYSYDLSQMVEHLNPISAKLYIPYAVSVMLSEGKLDAQAFSFEAIKNEKYQNLMKKVEVKEKKEYGRGPFGQKGSSIQIILKNGRMLEKEGFYNQSTQVIFPPERKLVEKFNNQTDRILSAEEKKELFSLIFNLEKLSDISPVVKFLIDTGN